ncbi:MAG: hypothetical protein R3D25_20835 [Geminicoccaceae bacterium]
MEMRRHRHPVLADLRLGPAAEALVVGHHLHVLEQVPDGRIVGDALDQVVLVQRDRDAEPLHRLVVAQAVADHPGRRVVGDPHDRAVMLHLDPDIPRQHEVEDGVAGPEDADAAMQQGVVRVLAEGAVDVFVVNRPALGARDLVLCAAGVLRRQRPGDRVGEVPEIDPWHVGQSIHRLATQYPKNPLLVRRHVALPRIRQPAAPAGRQSRVEGPRARDPHAS